MSAYQLCVVVPHYNHIDSLERFLPNLLGLNLPLIVVDDGSTAQNKSRLQALLCDKPSCHLVEHELNQGKGAAMLTGAKLAEQQNFTHMFQIDADGQHDVTDVARFAEYSREHPSHIVSGAPIFDESAPKARLYGRKVTDFWVAIETLSVGIKDSLCGFRIYPLKEFLQVHSKYSIGERMQVDTDVIVKSAWSGIPIHFIDTKVIYNQENVSHFHYLRDNLRLIWLHIKFMLGMLLHCPKLLVSRLTGMSASV